MKKFTIISGILFLCLTIFILSGCGALLTALIQAILGTKLGFIAIPAIVAAKMESSQSDKYPGMILLPSNNPPPGYSMAPGVIVSIEGYTGTVTTDANGFFRFDEVPVGIRKLKAEHPNFISIQQDVVVTEDGSEGRAFTGFKIVPDGPVTLSLLIDFIEVPQANYYFETYGLDPNGTAIRPSATWSVNSPDAVIDPNGAFRTTKAGRYIVTATSTLDTSISDTVEITVVESTMTLQGYVTEETSGSAVPGAEVTVNEVNLVARTDENGYYILSGVPAMSVITVNAKSASTQGSQTITVEDPTQPVEVNVTVHRIIPGPGGTMTPSLTTGNIVGTIYENDGNTAVGNAFVAFYSLSTSGLSGLSTPNQTTFSDPNGYFSFTGVPSGGCRLEFWRSESDYNSQPGSPAGAQNGTIPPGGEVRIDIVSGIVPTPVPTSIPTPAPQWTPQVSGTTQNLYGVYFLDASNGWAVGAVGTGRTIFRTTNGGELWQPITTDLSPSVTLYDVQFIDTNTGFASGNDGTDAHLYRTINGGSTWTSQYTVMSTGSNLAAIYFLNSTYGWTVGRDSTGAGASAYTTDGGTTWTPHLSTPGNTGYLYDVQFLDPNNGWAAGADTGAPSLGRTIQSFNGGYYWAMPYDATQGEFYGIYIADSYNGWAVGREVTSQGKIYYFDGSSWTQQYITNLPLQSVQFINSTTGWAAGNGGWIYHTTNGGSSWETQASNISEDIQAIYFIDEYTGWAVGNGGRIIHYSL